MRVRHRLTKKRPSLSTKVGKQMIVIAFDCSHSYDIDAETMSDITIETAATGLVGFWALSLVGRAVLHIYKTFLRPGKNLKKLGKWAVVTGATGESLQRQRAFISVCAKYLPMYCRWYW